MKSGSSSLSIRDALAQLAQLLDEPWTDQGDQLRDARDQDDHREGLLLEQLELALGDGESAPLRSESLKETRKSHPRLISMCSDFERDGRKLLRQAALVVRLSARSYDPDEAPPPELRNAIASLVDAVEKYLLLEADLAGEAAQDLGGEG